MRKTAIVVACLLLLSLFMLTASAMFPVPLETGEEQPDGISCVSVEDAGLMGLGLGPGSEVHFFDPIIEENEEYLQGVWLSNTEPINVEWKFYDPTWHLVYTDSHEPSVKKQGSFTGDDGETYRWIYADYTTFTLPAFCVMGDWVATATWHLSDGSSHKGMYNYGQKVDTPGSFFTSFFSAPVYFLGLKLPAPFWILGLIWVPALILVILIIWGRGIEGAVKIINSARAAGRRARAEWKKGSTKKS